MKKLLPIIVEDLNRLGLQLGGLTIFLDLNFKNVKAVISYYEEKS